MRFEGAIQTEMLCGRNGIASSLPRMGCIKCSEVREAVSICFVGVVLCGRNGFASPLPRNGVYHCVAKSAKRFRSRGICGRVLCWSKWLRQFATRNASSDYHSVAKSAKRFRSRGICSGASCRNGFASSLQGMRAEFSFCSEVREAVSTGESVPGLAVEMASPVRYQGCEQWYHSVAKSAKRFRSVYLLLTTLPTLIHFALSHSIPSPAKLVLYFLA